MSLGQDWFLSSKGLSGLIVTISVLLWVSLFPVRICLTEVLIDSYFGGRVREIF